MPSISPAASSAGASSPYPAAADAASSPSRADLDTLPAPVLIALLRSSFRRSRFDDVSEILAGREKSAAAAASRCADLERQLKDEKDRYAQLETKYGAVEESAENYRGVTKLLQECQVISEEENATLTVRVRQGQERIAQLEEQLQGSEMSKFVELKAEVQDYKCGKLRAEEEAEDWKQRCTDARARVAELSDEILALKAKAAVAENEKGTLREGADIGDGDEGGVEVDVDVDDEGEGDDYDGDDEVEEDNEGDKEEEEEENGPELTRLSSAGDVATSGKNLTPVQPPEEGKDDSVPSMKLNLGVKAGSVKEKKAGVVSSGTLLSVKSVGVSKEGGASAHSQCLIVISDSEEDCGMVGNGNRPDSVSVCGGNADVAAGEGNADAAVGDGDKCGVNSAPVSTQRAEGDPSVANIGKEDDDEDDTVPLAELKRKMMSEVAGPEPNAPIETQSGATSMLKRKRVSDVAGPEPNVPKETQSGTSLKRVSDVAGPEPNVRKETQSGTSSMLKRKRVSDMASPEPNAPSEMHSGTASSEKFSSRQLEKRRKILTPMAIYDARRP